MSILVEGWGLEEALEENLMIFFPQKLVEQVSARLSELQATLNAGVVHRQSVLTNIGYNLDYWVAMVISISLQQIFRIPYRQDVSKVDLIMHTVQERVLFDKYKTRNPSFLLLF